MEATEDEYWPLCDEPSEERAAWWERLLTRTHIPRSIKAPLNRNGDYEARVRRRWVDDFAIVDIECGPYAGGRDGTRLDRSRGEYMGFTFIRSGDGTVAQEGTEARLKPGDAVIWDSAKPIRFEVIEPLSKRSLLIPHHALDDVGRRALVNGGMPLDGQASAVHLLIGFLDTLDRTLHGLSPPCVTAARNAALDLFVGVLRHGEPLDSTAIGSALRADMEQWIARHLADCVTPDAIATAHSVSVRTVYRLFNAAGDTVGEFVRTRRLARAREDLIGGGDSISQIARRWHFSNSSHFSRAFKARYDISPSEYRKLNRSRHSQSFMGVC